MPATPAQASMFFAGLILLIPHRIGMSRVNYVIKRYNLPISRAGLLLYKYHNNIELSLFIGCVIGVLIVYAFQVTGKGTLKKSMVGTCILMLISSIVMFIIYISGGDFGHLNAFYFSLIFLTLFDGFTNAFAFGCNAANSALYAAGIPISGFLVTFFHNVYKFIFDKYHWDNFDYYVLFLQLIYNIITLSVTIFLWATVNDSSGNPPDRIEDAKVGDASELFSDHWPDWSPIFMLAFSLGTVYAFYPSIAPYSIIDYQYASIIELWILSISSSPTLLFAILDLIDIPGGGNLKKIGPGACLFKDSSTTNNSTGKGNWSTTSAEGHDYFVWWHLVWLSAIPYILCIQIFMSLLHYPHCLLSSFFNNNPYLIGFISVLFNTLREAMQAGGFAGAGKQYYNGKFTVDDSATFDHDKIIGVIAATNKPITLFVMMFCVFTGDGYLQHYRRCCRDCWPTTGYTKYQSFFYWLHFGFKGGIKSITSSFTDLYYHNLRPQFISYA